MIRIGTTETRKLTKGDTRIRYATRGYTLIYPPNTTQKHITNTSTLKAPTYYYSVSDRKSVGLRITENAFTLPNGFNEHSLLQLTVAVVLIELYQQTYIYYTGIYLISTRTYNAIAIKDIVSLRQEILGGTTSFYVGLIYYITNIFVDSNVGAALTYSYQLNYEIDLGLLSRAESEVASGMTDGSYNTLVLNKTHSVQSVNVWKTFGYAITVRLTTYLEGIAEPVVKSFVVSDASDITSYMQSTLSDTSKIRTIGFQVIDFAQGDIGRAFLDIHYFF